MTPTKCANGTQNCDMYNRFPEHFLIIETFYFLELKYKSTKKTQEGGYHV